VTTTPATTTTVTTAPTATTTPVVTTAPVAATTTTTGEYKDGTYTGSVENAYYGNVQVQAVVSGGKLTDVTFLEYPSDNGHSQQINQRAAPVLKSEAISAQSAKVNTVSGATDTSEAFSQSLSSALSQAQA
jgi:uncharacterized protein with FMN-binding domain